MLLWPHTDPQISRNARDSGRFCSWAEKGRGGARGRKEKEHDLFLFQISLAHWDSAAGCIDTVQYTAGVTHRTQRYREAYLLALEVHKTKGRQRQGPFCSTPPLNSEQSLLLLPKSHFPSSQGGQGPTLCWAPGLFWIPPSPGAPPLHPSHCSPHLEGDVLLSQVPPNLYLWV